MKTVKETLSSLKELEEYKQKLNSKEFYKKENIPFNIDFALANFDFKTIFEIAEKIGLRNCQDSKFAFDKEEFFDQARLLLSDTIYFVMMNKKRKKATCSNLHLEATCTKKGWLSLKFVLVMFDQRLEQNKY